MSRFSVVIATERPIDGAPPDSIVPYVIGSDGVLSRLADGRPVAGLVPPLPCIALAGWTPAAMPLLDSVRAELAIVKPALTPNPTLLEGAPSWQSVLAAAFDGMERHARAQSLHLVRLVNELAEMRTHYERAQEGLAGLESFFVEAKIRILEQAFVNEPDASFAFPPASPDKAPAPIRQVLPTSTKCLAAVSIHVAKAAEGAAGYLHAAIACPEAGETLWRWQVPVAGLAPGWLTFGGPRTQGGLGKTAILELWVEGDGGGLRLSTGAPNPLPHYQLDQHPDAEVSRRSLALRTFVSPPFVTVSHEPTTILPTVANAVAPPSRAATKAPRNASLEPGR